jgi:hypothetical protein
MPYVCAKGPHGAHRQDCHGFEGALTHDVIHGLDVTVPLGIGRHVPEERLRIVLHGITKPKPLKYFGVDLRGIELCADDTQCPISSQEQRTQMPLGGRGQGERDRCSASHHRSRCARDRQRTPRVCSRASAHGSACG